MVASVTTCMGTHDHLSTPINCQRIRLPPKTSSEILPVSRRDTYGIRKKSHDIVVGVISIFISFRRISSGSPRTQPTMHAAIAIDMLAKGLRPVREGEHSSL